MFPGQLVEGRVGVEAVRAGQRRNRFSHQLAIAADPWRDRTAEQ
jgi:hypothetical protein